MNGPSCTQNCSISRAEDDLLEALAAEIQSRRERRGIAAAVDAVAAQHHEGARRSSGTLTNFSPDRPTETHNQMWDFAMRSMR